MTINSKKEHFFFYCLGCAALLFYGSIIYTHAINMPKWDDFPDILQFIDHWLKADTLQEKFSVFFYHTNEHILLVNHVIILAQYYLAGHLDFAWLIYLGNLFYLGSACVLWLAFRHSGQAAYAFCILMLTGLSFYPYDSTLWAMTAISNQAVIFFALLAIYFSSQGIFYFYRVALCTALAIFSQSNGFLLLPLIALLAWFYHREKCLHWLVFSALISLFYLAVYHPASQANLGNTLFQANAGHIFWVLPTWIAGYGSLFFNEGNTKSLLVSAALGAVILFFCGRQIQQKQFPTFLLFVLLFLTLCLGSIAIYRGLVAGPSIIFTSRYKMYAAYFLAVGLLLSPQWLQKSHDSALARYGILSVALAFFVASFYLNLPRSRLIDGHLRESLMYWVEDGDFRRGKGFFVKDSDSYLFAAIHNGSWSPLALIEEKQILRNVSSFARCPETVSGASQQAAPPLQGVTLQLKHINRNAPAIRLELFAPSSFSPQTLHIYLCSASAAYRVTLPRWQPAAGNALYYLPAARISAGNYRTYLEMDGQRYVASGTFLRKSNTR